MIMEKMFINNRIANIRSSNNISARALSLELGMSSEYINQVENGRITPSLDFVINFCEYFKISLSEFFEEELKYPIEYKYILEQINKLTKEELGHILALMEMLNNKKN